MTPTQKDPQIVHLLNKMYPRDVSIANNQCVFCRSRVNEQSFRDQISLREFRISGMCQACQDGTFGS